MDSSRHRRRGRWALSGAVILVLVNLVFSWSVGGAEWTDSAIFGSPLAAALGLGLGYLTAVLRDVLRR
jgi:hypothetical protein